MLFKNFYFVKLGKVYNNNLLLKRIRKYSKREKELRDLNILEFNKLEIKLKYKKEKLEVLSKKLYHLGKTEFLLKDKIAVENIYIGSLEIYLKNLQEKGSSNLQEKFTKFEKNLNQDYINKVKIKLKKKEQNYERILNNYNKTLEKINDLTYFFNNLVDYKKELKNLEDIEWKEKNNINFCMLKKKDFK